MEIDEAYPTDSKYKIVGDVYEIRDDGTLAHIPNQMVLSRLAYKHESYVIVGTKSPPNFERMFNLGVGIFLVTISLLFCAHLLITGQLL